MILVPPSIKEILKGLDPLGLILSCDGVRMGLATDLGRSTHLVEDRLRGCRALVLEFNHDEDMLARGPYPLYLKRRIQGPDGHLSNRQAGELLRCVAHGGLKVVVLAHLSEVNNDETLARGEGERILRSTGLRETRILISRQDRAMAPVEL